MKVAMYYSNNDVRIEEQPVPELQENEVLMKIKASGLCGTDVVEWYRRDKVPLVLGHEVSGIVEKTAPGIKEYKAGDRIAVSHHVPCLKCDYCKSGHESVCDTLRKTKFYPGGFAEYLRIPAINIEKRGVYKLPDKVSFEEATFIEPLACCIRGQSLARIGKGKSVLILGAGLSGLLHIQLARLAGASKITATDVVDYRLSAAKKFGADETIKPNKLTGKFDLVIICTGADKAYQQAFDAVQRGGTILFFAATRENYKIELDVNKVFWKNEVTLTSSYAASPDEHRKALELIADGKINVKDMITHRLLLEKAAEGFKLVAEARESLKVIIEP